MNFIRFFLSFFLLLNFFSCSALEQQEKVKVFIEKVNGSSSSLKIIFVNDSNSDFFLSKFIFCKNEMIFQDVFQVNRNDGKQKSDKGYYGGIVDAVDSGILPKDKLILIKPNEKLSCAVDVGFWYAVYESGKYKVTYNATNPTIDSQKSIQLISNQVEVDLTARDPNISTKGKK